MQSAPKGLFLRNLRIKNLRALADVEIEFQQDLTLLVGENNSGKSSVLDALRLATNPLNGRRTRYFERDDFREGEKPIEIQAEFDQLSYIQRGQFLTGLNLETNRLCLGLRCPPFGTKKTPVRLDYLSGDPSTVDLEVEKRNDICHVYLPPLRDAKRELDSFAGNRLSQIMHYLFEDHELEHFRGEASKHFGELGKLDLLRGLESSLQTHVSDLTSPIREHIAGVTFREPSLYRLVSGLRLQLAEQGVQLADIANSGLGYANLLYMATIILELQNSESSELTLFLVDEPEAHLHPQLQVVLMDYLRTRAAESTKEDANRPAGRIQVIATSHSPSVAASTGTKHIVAMRTVLDSESETRPQRSAAINIGRFDLEKADRRKIDQYLDVTKSELLFTRSVVLVEGLAEAVLLPTLAKYCVLGSQKDLVRRFRGISVISLGSVDFVPYLKLLLQIESGHRLVDRLIVITDGDPDLEDVTEGIETAQSRANRKEVLETVAAGMDATHILQVFQSRYTLEADLAEPVISNGEVLRKALVNQKPVAGQRHWDEIQQAKEPSQAFYRKLRSRSNFISKGEFAYDIAGFVPDHPDFVCPPYLREAILAAVAADPS